MRGVATTMTSRLQFAVLAVEKKLRASDKTRNGKRNEKRNGKRNQKRNDDPLPRVPQNDDPYLPCNLKWSDFCRQPFSRLCA